MDKWTLKKNVALEIGEMAVILDSLERHRDLIKEERSGNAFVSMFYDEIELLINSAERKIRKVFEKVLTSTTEK